MMARIYGIEDIRGQGSGNAGATNLLRTAGWTVALPVLLAEFFKGYFVIWMARTMGLGALAPTIAFPYVLGNLYPVFHRFKGGKGVAAMTGTCLAIDPLVMLLGGSVFLVVFRFGKIVSLGSLSMILSYPVWLLMLGGTETEFMTFSVMTVLTPITHRANIIRLIRGEEPRLGRGVKERK
jgi:glycerol-3-phosphate acyltransferase PlsY